MRRIFITAFIYVMAYSGLAQGKPADSLTAKMPVTTDLREKYRLLDQISSNYYKLGTIQNPLDNSLEMIRIALQLRDDSLIAKSYNVLGDYYTFIKGDNNTALEYFFKGIPYAEKIKNGRTLPSLYLDISIAYQILLNPAEQLRFLEKAKASLPDITHPEYDYLSLQLQNNYAGYYLTTYRPQEALPHIKSAEAINQKLKYPVWELFLKMLYGSYYTETGDTASARVQFEKGLDLDSSISVPWVRYVFRYYYVYYLLEAHNYAEAKKQTNEILRISRETGNDNFRLAATHFSKTIFANENKLDSAYYYAGLESALKDTVFSQQVLNKIQALNFNEEVRLKEEDAQRRQKIRTIVVVAVFFTILLIVLILYRNNRQRRKANIILQKTLSDLRSTQSQLIQSEKMASLGELTAGIAHEIQNPLNFVNNFSEVNNELIEEVKTQKSNLKSEELDGLLNDIFRNNEKISHHGKRADAIVKGMLQHSRNNTGQKEAVNINVLVDEYARLAYHGLKARDKTFNAKMETDFDSSAGLIKVAPQDIGRVALNLINNAFYAVDEKMKQNIAGYEPAVMISTKKSNSTIEIKVSDNGKGIPQKVLDKIFQPFFTTKPTGQGTGLGLSLAYDIIKAHSGEIKVETREGEGTAFIIKLPMQ